MRFAKILARLEAPKIPLAIEDEKARDGEVVWLRKIEGECPKLGGLAGWEGMAMPKHDRAMEGSAAGVSEIATMTESA